MLSHILSWDQDVALGHRGRVRAVPLRRDRRAVISMEYAIMAGMIILIILSATGPFLSGLATLLGHMTDAL